MASHASSFAAARTYYKKDCLKASGSSVWTHYQSAGCRCRIAMSDSDSVYSSPVEAAAAASSSSDFESEFNDSTDSEDARLNEQKARAAAYKAHREEVAKLRNLRQAARVVEESEDSSQDSDDESGSDEVLDEHAPTRQASSAALSARARQTDGAQPRLNSSGRAAEGQEDSSTSGAAASDDGTQVSRRESGSPSRAAPDASSAHAVAQHASTCCSQVDFWASAALIQALQRTCQLPKLDISVSFTLHMQSYTCTCLPAVQRLEHALIDTRKHNVLWRIMAQRLVKPFTKSARSWR